MPLLERSWEIVIKEYSQKVLTYDSDLLPALAGIAKRFAEKHKGLGKYVTGLWEANLICWRCWFSYHPCPSEVSSSRRREGMLTPARRQPHDAKHFGPSFSWPSRFGPCETYYWATKKDMDECASVVEVVWDSGSSNPFLRVKSARIRLVGTLVKALLLTE